MRRWGRSGSGALYSLLASTCEFAGYAQTQANNKPVERLATDSDRIVRIGVETRKNIGHRHNKDHRKPSNNFFLPAANLPSPDVAHGFSLVD